MRSPQLPQHVTAHGASGAPRDLRAYGLREHLATLFRHKFKMLAVFSAALFVAVAGSYLASKVFIASSRILVQIEREPLRLGSITGAELAATEIRAREQVLTEAEIFRSPLLTQQLARRLGADYMQENLTWRWDRIRNLPDRVKTAIKSALFAFGPTRALLTAIGMEAEGEEDAEIKILLVGGLIGDHIEVEPVLQTDVMAATFRAPDPVFAAQALNELVDIYLDHHLKLRQRPAAMEIVDVEARRLKDRLDQAQNRLQDFKRDANIVSVDVQKEHLLGELSDVRAKLFEARSQLSESTGRIAEIGKQLQLQSNAKQLSTVMVRDPVTDELRTTLVQLELERDQYNPSSPTAAEVEKKISDIRGQLESRTATVSGMQTSGVNEIYVELSKTLSLEHGNRGALQARVDQHEQQMRTLREALAELDQREAQFAALSRDVEVVGAALRKLLEKQEDMRISETLNFKRISNVIPIERATPPVIAAKPRKKLLLALGLVIGLVGAVGAAYVADFFRRSLSTREEAEDALGKPVLAALWEEGADTAVAAQNLPEFRRLGQLLATIKNPAGAMTVLLLSTHEHEGKSFVAEALVNVLETDGKRVSTLRVSAAGEDPPALAGDDGQDAVGDDAAGAAIVPADASDPDGEAAGAEPTADSDAAPDDSEESGAKPQHAAGIRAILDRIDGESPDYDVIVIDGNALANHPEQLLLCDTVNAVLLIVEADKTPAVSADQSIQAIERVEGPFLGIVMNKRRRFIPGWVYGLLLSPRRAAAAAE